MELEPPTTTGGDVVDPALARRLAWVTALRLVFLAVLLAAIGTFYLEGALDEHPQSHRALFAAVGAAFAATALWATWLRSGRRLATLARAQIVVDQLVWTVVVYVSGGVTSGATSFYGLTCLVGAVLAGAGGSLLAAAVGISAYLALAAGFASGALVPPPDQPHAAYVTGGAALTWPLLLNVIGVAVVALLAGYLADRLRVAGGALERAEARLERAERLALLGRLAAGLAHEIRNPLGAIAGSVEMLRDAPGLDAEDRRLFDIVERETRRLGLLVNDMMDLARPKAPDVGSVELVTLAREVVTLAAGAGRGAGGDVPVRLEAPDDATFEVRVDAAQLRQVLWNLVRNAVEVNPPGEPVRVLVDSPTPGKVRVAVEDRGPGIPDAKKALVFDEFYTTRTKGSGLGLAVVRRIVDAHAGLGMRIAVEDAVPAGTRFEVRLPLAHAGPATGPVAPPSRRSIPGLGGPSR